VREGERVCSPFIRETGCWLGSVVDGVLLSESSDSTPPPQVHHNINHQHTCTDSYAKVFGHLVEADAKQRLSEAARGEPV
jgi:hypothetical protein